MAAAMTVAEIAVATEVVIAAVEAVGAAVAVAIAADGRRAVRAAGAICRLPNTPRPRVANRAATIIVVDSHATMTTGVRKLRAALLLLLRWTPSRTRLFFPASHSQNIAASLRRLLCRLQ
jgi:hypothetical protein